MKLHTKLSAFLLVLLFGGLAVNSAVAGTFTATGDSFIKENTADKNKGNKAFLRVRKTGRMRSLVQFDQQDIADFVAGNPLQSAKLRL